MTRSIDDVEPGRLYPLSEVASFIPSTHAGKKVHYRTLTRWRRQGRLNCQSRQAGDGRRHYFVWGAEIIRFLGGEQRPQLPKDYRTPTQARRDHEAAVERLRKRGLVCGNGGDENAKAR
jgi:hypothetical protein